MINYCKILFLCIQLDIAVPNMVLFKPDHCVAFSNFQLTNMFQKHRQIDKLTFLYARDHKTRAEKLPKTLFELMEIFR